MTPSVKINIKAELLPFGVWYGVLQIGSAVEGAQPGEPEVVEPTTLANRFIAPAPGRVVVEQPASWPSVIA